jgi:hypothetical protein
VWPHALNPSHVRTTPQRWVRPKRQLPPGFIRPCQPILAAKVPAGDGWLHELKHDGYRIVALKDGERVVAHWPRRPPAHELLLDHLISPCQNAFRYLDAYLGSSLQIDQKLEPGRLLYRQVTWLSNLSISEEHTGPPGETCPRGSL